MSTASQSAEDRTADLKTTGVRASKRADWRVTQVDVIGDYRLRVAFEDGFIGEVIMDDLLLSSRSGVFEPLKDPERFRQVCIVLGAVTWPGELDLAPDAMYDDIKRYGICQVRASR